ncbi:hypothetical protein [Streptomyces sp. SAJ15]|uniref:hypothetical protein n=1 Tax=Streptomyces sp. SAJ15 TaxID=2011095 RepID=UPI001186A486|nr:hypothetical protein [Streptomyces sp. SAJ15]TVL93546.1 hypothetical protein CD790_00265 [Streptomyces sp. SAJ15]
MDIRRIDPRDTAWEEDHARYRVSFWDVPAATAHEYEVLGEVDVDDVLAWASPHAAERGWTYTVYASVGAGDRAGEGPGLIRLAGVLGDPFADA